VHLKEQRGDERANGGVVLGGGSTPSCRPHNKKSGDEKLSRNREGAYPVVDGEISWDLLRGKRGEPNPGMGREGGDGDSGSGGGSRIREGWTIYYSHSGKYRADRGGNPKISFGTKKKGGVVHSPITRGKRQKERRSSGPSRRVTKWFLKTFRTAGKILVQEKEWGKNYP